jgi:prepilin-type processing-associated H-X9-DG protein
LEQATLHAAYNFQFGAEGPSSSYAGFHANATVTANWIDTFVCPSDDRREPFRFQFGIGDVRSGAMRDLRLSRGNYGASWGNTSWPQLDLTSRPVRFLPSAFGLDTVRLASVRDGLSGTVLLAEIRQGAETDVRGLLWWPAIGATNFVSRFTPNAFRDVYEIASADQLGEQWSCRSEAGLGLPCVFSFILQDPDALLISGAKSRHPGGVNVLFGDGSVRFLKETIETQVWVGINSIRGGEVVPADQF